MFNDEKLHSVLYPDKADWSTTTHTKWSSIWLIVVTIRTGVLSCPLNCIALMMQLRIGTECKEVVIRSYNKPECLKRVATGKTCFDDLWYLVVPVVDVCAEKGEVGLFVILRHQNGCPKNIYKCVTLFGSRRKDRVMITYGKWGMMDLFHTTDEYKLCERYDCMEGEIRVACQPGSYIWHTHHLYHLESFHSKVWQALRAFP